MIKAIVAVDKKWGIGKNNGLLFSLPEDMKFSVLPQPAKPWLWDIKRFCLFPVANRLKIG